MTYNQIKMALYATFLTNWYGLKLKKLKTLKDKKRVRIEYATVLLKSLNIEIKVINEHNIPKDENCLLVSNHRTIADPVIIEMATKNNNLQGHWIAKKSLADSFFFGMFVRNGGAILIDRDSSKMNVFFKDIKKVVQAGDSIYIFPEGTRNKTDDILGEFKEGTQLIALKNRLDILPVYIRNRADNILFEAIADSSKERVIEVEFGEIISYKDRDEALIDKYKKTFNIS